MIDLVDDDPPRILVFEEKHGRRYFAATTEDEVHAVALMILAERISEGYFEDPEEPEMFETQAHLLTDEQIFALPSKALRTHAKALAKQALHDMRQYHCELEECRRARQAVFTLNGAQAWAILCDRDRRNFEYEGFEFEFLESVRMPIGAAEDEAADE